MKRFFSMLLAGVLCVSMMSVLVGCGSASDNTPTVATIDGEDLKSSELAAYIVYNMMYYENSFGMDISYMADDAIFSSIKEGCLNQCVQYRAIEKLAKQEGVSLNSDAKKELKENKTANQEALGSTTSGFGRWLKYSVKGEEDPFVTYLNSYGYTEELYDKNCEVSKLQELLTDKYYDDGTILEQYNQTYLHAKSILISDNAEDGTVMTGDAFTAAQTKAQEILDKVNAGEDFDTLWSENNSDTAQPEAGYYFTEGDMVDEYYNAVKDMEVGSFNSELVYYEGYGWFIIERLELDEAALTDTAAYLGNSSSTDSSSESTIKTAIGSTLISNKLDEVTEAMDVQTNDEYDKITAYNVNTYLPFTADAYVSEGSGSGSAADTTADTTTDAADTTTDTGSAAAAG